MLRTLTLTAALSALTLAGAASAQDTPQPGSASQPPVSQSPPVTADPQNPATQEDTQAPSSTSAMPATGTSRMTAPSSGETPPATGGMQRPAGDTASATPAAGQPFSGATQTGDIVSALRASGQFTTLIGALESTRLTDVLQQQRPYTLFAPTDAAFAALPEARRTALTSDLPALQRLLLHHVVGTAVTGDQLRALRGTANTVPMADNTPQAVTGSGDEVRLGAARVIQADVRVGDDVIHAVDAIIMPSGAAATPAAAGAPAPTPVGAATTPPTTTTPGR